MPNVDYPDFAAIDRFINIAKAGFFATGPAAGVAAGQYNRALGELQKMGIVASLIGLPEMVELFRTTHQRLYLVFAAWDEGLAGCGLPGAAATWAATYSEWMTSHLASRGGVYTDAAAAWYQTLDDGVAGGAAVPTYTQLTDTYPAASFSIPVDAMASGLDAPARVKRQDACTLSSLIPSNSISSAPSSGTFFEKAGFSPLH